MSLWTLNRLIVLFLLGAFVVLMFEIRSEHQDVLGEHTIAWTPIIYSGLMIIVSFACLFFWRGGGRQILFWAFAAALIVGVVGFWQHNEHHFGQRINYVFTVWGNSTAKKQESDEHSEAENQDHHSDGDHDHELSAPLMPPVLAPLTFAGLGILGMLACAKRFQPELIT